MVNSTNGWDIYARSFSGNGVGGAVALVNTTIYGDQYAPRASAIGTDYLVVWTSLGQDGSREGVFGQFLHGIAPVDGEFRVNTTTAGQQMQPVATSDGASQFVVVWTSYTGSPYSFDLFAQRYIKRGGGVAADGRAVCLGAVHGEQRRVSAAVGGFVPVLLGISVSNYEVYVDGAATPAAVVANNQIINGQYYQWTMTTNNGLTTSSTHSFQVDYITTDGRRSPLSPSASGNNVAGLQLGWNSV